MHLCEAHLLEPRLHDQLVQQVATLQVVELGQVVGALDLLVVHEEVHPVYPHCFEVASEFDIAHDLDQIPQQTLQTAALLDAVSDALVKCLEASLRRWHLVLDPRREVERVVEDLLVGRAAL